MNILLDKLSASLITGTIFLMIFTINTNNQETLTETTAFYALTRQSEEFAKILRSDLQSIEEVLTVEEVSHESGGTAFRFQSRIGSDATLYTIAYVKKAVDGRDGYYQIERYVNGVQRGGSYDVITDWEILALNEDAGTITDPANAAQVFVRFEATSPFLETEVVKSIKWESRFFPPMRN